MKMNKFLKMIIVFTAVIAILAAVYVINDNAQRQIAGDDTVLTIDADEA